MEHLFVGGKKVDDLTLVRSCTNAGVFVHILKVQTQAAASSKMGRNPAYYRKTYIYQLIAFTINKSILICVRHHAAAYSRCSSLTSRWRCTSALTQLHFKTPSIVLKSCTLL